ncbi:UDP-N-acetylmuramoyl-tripeptide--D-alanyl-D-alanine ligase [Corynebacterium mendelii]|uniref:UDP-N-acetylmuramoyl-tripeptide--D-alanyl-D-alanine ligase n=1 Tax=Corynebacterium mendelii TaxID=2765362 RepID=A0A939DZJ0_9CORY|nr:UDP-N-acetylmuramoyl-tripeptide--D-alanyl-D-alanine ligase [Corynebacterium mendelii]MBN9643098.1 UDP-N-acetylmuramoyl-tripeptide--D-alanyl-D-alanine ligase [Corynebacterium mendelii]
MIEMTLAEIAQITGGKLAPHTDGDTPVAGTVEFDSRAVGAGSLFICLPGARVDGHDFAAEVIGNGAAGVLCARDTGVPGVIVPHTDKPMTNAYIYDNDPGGDGVSVVKALSLLARSVVDRLAAGGMKVAAVTGSAGKTSTKDMIATVLTAAAGSDDPAAVVAPPGSFNNEIGLPYTALKATAGTRWLVAEMSARGVDHIRQLTEITPPDIGVVLNVGTAHLGEFGSVDTIAEAKGELVEALPPTGVAVLNADDPRVAAMAQRTRATVITFSTRDTGADVTATGIELDELSRARFVLHASGDSAPVSLKVFGAHQVPNALAAAAVGLEAGMDVAQVAAALSEHVAASANRMDVTTRRDRVTIINDSYNANPDSMKAGIDALASMAAARGNATSWAVIGQMGELGDDAVAQHEAIADYLAEHHIDRVVAVGNDVATRAMANRAGELGLAVDRAQSTGAAANIVDQHLTKGDVVLVKASQVERLWEVAELLIERDRSRRVL